MEISRIDLNKPERVSNTIVIDLFTKNYQRLNTEFFEFQFDWLNRAYAAFKDFDKYMILAYLFRKTFFSYSELFKVITFEQFFSNLSNVPSAILTKGITPISIKDGEYSGLPNPHAWMSLDSSLIYVDNIRDAFVKHDPANAISYKTNAEAYKRKIKDTILPLKNAVLEVPKEKRWLVSCEGAFSYLARDFKMNELYIWPINAGAQGTPKQVKRVIDSVRKNNIPAVFCESTVSQAPAQQISRETGATYGGVLYVDSLTKANGPVPSYIDLLKVTSETIVTGLQ